MKQQSRLPKNVSLLQIGIKFLFLNLIQGWPKQDLVHKIWQYGCHLVAKFPRGSTIPEHEKEFLWRYSFSAAEKNLFLQGGQGEAGSCSKQVLRILKALNDDLQLQPLTSYHLKTMLFYECEANPHHSRWSSNCLGKRFLGILQRLETCLSQRYCPHYFMRRCNLFERFPQQRCIELALKIHLVRIHTERVLSLLINFTRTEVAFLKFLFPSEQCLFFLF